MHTTILTLWKQGKSKNEIARVTGKFLDPISLVSGSSRVKKKFLSASSNDGNPYISPQEDWYLQPLKTQIFSYRYLNFKKRTSPESPYFLRLTEGHGSFSRRSGYNPLNAL